MQASHDIGLLPPAVSPAGRVIARSRGMARPRTDSGEESGLKARQIGTIAALMALGVAAPGLKAHIDAALDAGCSRTEITEVIRQMTLFAGLSAALESLAVASQVFAAQSQGRASRSTAVHSNRLSTR